MIMTAKILITRAKISYGAATAPPIWENEHNDVVASGYTYYDDVNVYIFFGVLFGHFSPIFQGRQRQESVLFS